MAVRSFLTLALVIICFDINAQSTNASNNEDYYHWLDRYEVKAGRLVSEIFTTLKPYKRDALVVYLDSLNAKDNVFKSAADQFNYDYFRNDSWEWSRTSTNEAAKPVLKNFYRKKSDMAYVDRPEFDLHVNPVLYLGVGMNKESAAYASFPLERTTFVNTRGVEVRGMVDRKIGFYTFFTENQAVLPVYVHKRLYESIVVPHEGFWKTFKSNGVDFFQARGYIDFNVSRHVYMQLGHDKMFVGNGLRSLIYSDYAPPQLYWRTNVKVWKLNYLFQINRMTADVSGNTSGLTGADKYPEKYVAFHHASFNIGRKLNLGFFESVVFSPLDPSSGTTRNSFELNYFNPLIFYRAIEQQNGSSDNAILGADFKWNALKGVSIYGQFVLDEFVLSHVKARDGWWANKYGFQAGVKYIDVLGVSNLDLQLEANAVRPYTYSHNTSYGNYTNYRQPIAHPLGANFREVAAILRYQPLPRLNLVAKFIYAEKGTDADASSYGGDLLKRNNTRVQEFDNKIGQGTLVSVTYADFTASYMIRHNLFIDAKAMLRRNKTASDGPAPPTDYISDNTTSTLASMALRWNIAPRNYDF